MAEHAEQSVALGVADVAFVAVDDAQHVLAVAPNHGPVGLGVDLGGQHRRVHQVGEEDGQSSDFAVTGRCGQQIFGVAVGAVDRENLLGDHRRRRAVALVDGLDRTVEQPVDALLDVGRTHNGTVTGMSSLVGAVAAMPSLRRVTVAE